MITTTQGTLFAEDRLIRINGYAPKLEELEKVIGPGGAPEMHDYIEWAKSHVPYPPAIGGCESLEHAARVAFAMMVAQEYFDPRYAGGLHGFTARRLRNVAG